MTIVKVVVVISLIVVSAHAWGQNKYDSDPYVTQLGFSVDQAAYFDSINLSYLDANILVKNGGLRTFDDINNYYLKWKNSISYSGTSDPSMLNNLIVKDIVEWKAAGFSLSESIKWKRASNESIYSNYPAIDFFKCKKNGVTIEAIVDLSRQAEQKLGVPRNQIIDNGWVISLLLLPDLFKVFSANDLLILLSNKELLREMSSKSLQFGTRKTAIAVQWKTRELTALEIVNYMILTNDVEQAVALKSQGINPRKSKAIQLALSESIYKMYTVPDYNLKKPYEYSFKVRSYVLFTSDSSALERFVVQGLKDNYNISAMTGTFAQTKYEIFGDNESREVYVLSERKIECPWGSRKIIKVEFLDSKEIYWVPEIGIQ